MLERVRRALGESYVGAVALGILLAQGINHFVSIFASPVGAWVMRKEYQGALLRATYSSDLPMRLAVTEFVDSFLLLLMCYLLLRWLYFQPLTDETPEPAREASPPPA